jgi:siroheme synthase
LKISQFFLTISIHVMTEPNLEKGQVILVGAGPGDIGLLTLRGKDWLVRADVVIHLVNSNMLRFASSAELIYVGKKVSRKIKSMNC